MMITKKRKKLKFWRHKKYPGKKFTMNRTHNNMYRQFYQLTYRGPRGGIIKDGFFSWQDAKAAGWRKCK